MTRLNKLDRIDISKIDTSPGEIAKIVILGPMYVGMILMFFMLPLVGPVFLAELAYDMRLRATDEIVAFLLLLVIQALIYNFIIFGSN